MIKSALYKLFRSLGYDVRKITPQKAVLPQTSIQAPPPADPIWPLPRGNKNLSDEDIREAFGKFNHWHYAFQFEGGLTFERSVINPNPKLNCPQRPLQRFRHFFPYLLDAENGSLKGKRVLDIACNSGFWSIQCALMGADVVGFDARPELIEQANLVRSIVGAENAEFKVLDFWDMNPESLGGTFDVVLNLGILYHLPDPVAVLNRTKRMTNGTILLDTAIDKAEDTLIRLEWEEAFDIRATSKSGIVSFPTRSSIDLILRHINCSKWKEIPVRTKDMPFDYLNNKRASWVIKV